MMVYTITVWYKQISLSIPARDKFANSVDPDEVVAHNEPYYLDLQCLPSSL